MGNDYGKAIKAYDIYASCEHVLTECDATVISLTESDLMECFAQQEADNGDGRALRTVKRLREKVNNQERKK